MKTGTGLYLAFAFALAVTLGGCGGGSDDGDIVIQGSGDSSGGGDSGSGGSTGGTETYRLGSFDDSGQFQEGTLRIGVDTLSAGGSTSITANIVDSGGAAATDSANVTFTSTCTAQGQASLDSPIATTNGRASSTYVAEGCQTTDLITASTQINGDRLEATGSLDVQGASIGSIQFVSAEPGVIALRGTGGAGRSETATVVFRVVNSVGGAVTGADVEFSLNTQAGGIELSPATATSDDNGLVQTVVRSGNVHTSVRVTATVTDTNPAISTQSDSLAISSGVPDQNSISLSAETLNPEAWGYDGEQVNLNVWMADHFNNPVPDGTSVAFVTEGGQVVDSCTTEDGTCTVAWTSAAPRPADGRSTVIAYAIGEESFVDDNGNGLMDSGESFTDLGEAFLDTNENGVRDAGSDEFFDFDGNGVYDGPDGAFTGVLCAGTDPDGDGSVENPDSNGDGIPDHCSADQNTLHISDELVLIMAGSSATFTPDCDTRPALDLSGGTVEFSITVNDVNDQPMPEGTTMNATTSHGTLVGRSTQYTWPSTNAAGGVTIDYRLEPEGQAGNGLFTLAVETPKGLTSYCEIDVTE